MDQDTETPQPRARSTFSLVGRIALGLLLGAFAVMWIYVFLPSSKRPPAGLLDSSAFPVAAEPVCAETLAEIDALPLAHETRTPEERADVLEEANVALATMLTELRPLAPRTGDDARMVGEWLDDWQTFIGDRGELAAELATGADARLTETAKAGDHISEALDRFAEVNGMPSCATPGDA